MISEETLTDRMRRFVELVERKRQLESELRAIGVQIELIEPILLEDMAGAGMQNATVDGMTVYRQSEFTCGIKPELDKQAVFQSFIDSGYGHLVMLGWSALRSMVKEASESGQPLPECVEKSVDVGQIHRLRARRA